MKSTLTLLSLLALVLVCGGSIVKLPLMTSERFQGASPAITRLARNANANANITGTIQVLYTPLTLTGSNSLFRLILDSGSQIATAISSKCSCGFPVFAQYDASNLTSIGSFSQTYFSGQALSGNYYNINVQLGGLSSNVPFGLITDGQGTLAGYDGILGIARVRTAANGCNATTGEVCTPNLIQSFVSNNVIAAEIFAVGIDYNGNGQLVLGGDDPSLYVASSMLYFPLYAETFYVVAGNGLFVGNADTTITAANFGNVLIDTGTSNLVFPTPVFTLMAKQFNDGVCKNTTVLNCGNLFTTTSGSVIEDIRDRLPPLVFVIEASTVTVSPYSYLVQTNINGGLRWVLAIQILDSPGFPTTLLGAAFFRGKYVLHDMTYKYEDPNLSKIAHGRIGIANLAGVNVSVSSSSGIYTTITSTTTGDTSAAEKAVQMCSIVLFVAMSVLLSLF